VTGAPAYAQLSYWLESCGDDLTPRPALGGDTVADIAILGAGFSGLWTAYYLLRADPTLRVVVLEAEIAGFGASGRNGAWCTSGFGAGPEVLRAKFGADAARAVHDAMSTTVDEVGRVCADEGIDAQYQRDGELIVAIGAHQLPALDAIERRYEGAGLGGFHQRLSAAETRERLAVDDARGALFHPATAAVHPGRLVRGLARAVERRAGVIHEGTRVTAFAGGALPLLETAHGRVRADVVVLAGEAYLSQLAPLRRALLPLYSLIVLTEPLTPDQLAEIGWTHRAVAQSCALSVDYLSRTADGRILFGGRGAPYHYGSRITPSFDRHEPTFASLRAAVGEWFPSLRDITFTHAWGGCLGVPRDFVPVMRYDRASGIATARGYTGEGVAATNLAGRVLADLITGARSDLTQLPMTTHSGRDWEPEPLRFAAARLAQRGARRIDARAARTGVAPSGRSLTERLIGH
jgi:glycine/D-amino acid oxidase-like deaminating enzyme